MDDMTMCDDQLTYIYGNGRKSQQNSINLFENLDNN